MKTLGRFGILAIAAVWLWGCHSPAKPNAAVTAKTGGAQARRSVKTAIDADASKIDKTPQDTTIEDIVAQRTPSDIGERVAPFETSTWRVKAHLESVQLMKDGDYYLVMKGSKGGETVVEVPNPTECKNSPLEPEIAAARKQIEDKYHPTKDPQKINDDAIVSGVGFLGWGGKSKGAKGRTGPRLMPGTGFDFGTTKI